MDTAIKSDYFNIANFAKEKEAEKKGVSKEEQKLYALSTTPGWKILEEYMRTLMDNLDSFNAGAMNSGASFEEIGKNTVVINLAKDIVKKILNKVSDSKEACERPDGTVKRPE